MLNKENNMYIYYLEFEGLKLLTDRSSGEIYLTPEGLKLFKNIYMVSNSTFLFSYVLLENRESESDFTQSLKVKLNSGKLPKIISGNENIQLREIYLVEYKSNN